MFTFNIQNWNPVGMPLHNKELMDGASFFNDEQYND